MLVLNHSVVPDSAIPWTVAHQAPLSMGSFRWEYWSSCHFLLQGIVPTQGLSLHLLFLLHFRQILYLLSQWGSSKQIYIHTYIYIHIYIYLYYIIYIIHMLNIHLGGGHGNPLQYSCLWNPSGQRSLAGYSPWDRSQRVGHDWATQHSTLYYILIFIVYGEAQNIYIHMYHIIY